MDIPAATARGIVVMNTPLWEFHHHRRACDRHDVCAGAANSAGGRLDQAGKWEKSRFMGQELFSKTLGLIGCGNIGGIVADRAQGLKMRVIAYDPFLTEERAVELGVEAVDLDTLLSRADIITLHTPLTDQTRNILSEQALAKAKKGVRIVNCARGGLVDEQALAAALDSGHVAGAAFDVFTEEPAKENILFGRENVICTPHLGAATSEAQENVAIQVAEQLSDYLLLGAVSNALNMPSVTAEEAPRLKPYIDLAEKLGSLAGQSVTSGIKSIEITYAGQVSDLKVSPMTAAALAGALRHGLSDVNLVNAPAVAKDRGIAVKESRTATSPHYGATISIAVHCDKGMREFVGTLFGGKARVVRIGDIRLEAALSPNMLFVENDDKPGFIGALGQLLGEAGINIATFHLGRDEAGNTAIALVSTDGAVPKETLAKINALDPVRTALPLAF